MIIHVALYRFRADASKEQIEACIRELETSTEKTMLTSWYISGRHIALPVDQAISDMVYDYAVLWGFPNQQTLDKFSQHVAMKECVATFIRPILEKLAIVNFNGTDASFVQLAGLKEQQHVS